MEAVAQTVVYADDKFEKEYERLRNATNGDDRKAFSFMTRLREYLRDNSSRGKRIPKENMPKIYATLVGHRVLWELKFPRYGTIRYTAGNGRLRIVDFV